MFLSVEIKGLNMDFFSKADIWILSMGSASADLTNCDLKVFLP